MRVLDLFSGIGGFSLGLERAGMKTVRFVEIDPFCRRVLARHWPYVPCDEDITTAEFREGEADVICGGFPCQDVSRAGKRAGISGIHSGLYRELVRAIRVVRPKFAVLENVAALLGDGMGEVCGDLAESGYNLEWDCVPACAIGAPHQRDRIWIVAHAQGDGFGAWRAGRFADSFSRIRNKTRGDFADAKCAGLSNGDAKTKWESQPESARENGPNCWEAWPDEPALCGVDDGIPFELDLVGQINDSRGNQEKSDNQNADSSQNQLTWRLLRAMWENREIAASSPELYVNRLCDSLPFLPYGNSPERWIVGIQKTKELLDLWESFYAKPFQESQYLQPNLLERIGAQKRTKKMGDTVDRMKSLGNSLIPKIPEMIGCAIMDSLR